MAVLMPEGKQSFTDSKGAPLIGGKLFTYDVGTSTPRPTYQDAAGTTPNTNPIVLDARGEATVFWNGAYKVVLVDALGATIWSVDNILDQADQLQIDLTAQTGATLVGVVSPGAGSVARTVGDKLGEVSTMRDKGATVNGTADDVVAMQYLSSGGGLALVPSGTSVVNQAPVSTPVTLFGAGTLKTTTANRMILTLTKPPAQPDEYLVPGFKAVGMSYGPMADAISDDYAAVHLAAGKAPVVAFSDFYGTENGVTSGALDAKFNVFGYGTKDALIMGNYFELTKRFVVQNLQGSFTRMIGIAANSQGDNTVNGGTNPFPPVNNGGNNGGIRLGGICRGNIVAASNIRDKRTSINVQKGCDWNIVSGLYSENTYSGAIVASSGGVPLGQGIVIGDTILKDSGEVGLNFRYMSHSRFSGLIDRTGMVPASVSKFGADLYSTLGPSDEAWRLVFTGGSGVVPPAGTLITKGAASGVLVSVDAMNYVSVAAGGTVPSSGYIVVKGITGDYFSGGPIDTGITATIDRAYCCDGRHRVDANVRSAGSSSLRLGSSCNIIDLIAEGGAGPAADVSGHFNIVRLVIADNVQPTHLVVSGTGNIIIVTDNSVQPRTSISVTGVGNKIIGNIRGNAIIGGTNNCLDATVLGYVYVQGTDNDIGGSCTQLSKGTGTGHTYGKLRNSVSRGVLTATTDASGVLTIPHTCILPATSIKATVRSASLAYFTVSVNPTNTATTSTVRVWSAGGAPVASTPVTVEWEAEI